MHDDVMWFIGKQEAGDKDKGREESMAVFFLRERELNTRIHTTQQGEGAFFKRYQWNE